MYALRNGSDLLRSGSFSFSSDIGIPLLNGGWPSLDVIYCAGVVHCELKSGLIAPLSLS